MKKIEVSLFYPDGGWFLLLFLIVFLIIILSGKISPIAGLFIRSTPTPTPLIPNNYLEPGLDESVYIDMSVNDLAKLKGTTTDKISIKEVTRKEWNDTSLGCPKTGKLYAQMVTPGYLVILTYNNSDFLYHGGLNKVVLCQNR